VEKKSYYRILGVARTETFTGIRAAYRDLSRRLRPGVAGEGGARTVQELTEAYDVLSDPGRRRTYNAQLLTSLAPRSSRREPLVREEVAILGHPTAIRPSFEAMFERFRRNFTGRAVPKSERPEGLNVEVVLTSQELARGCVLPLGVPVFARCSRCGGSGHDWAFPCGVCHRQGVVQTRRLVRIRVPPMPSPGSVLEVPLQGLGIHNFYLRLHLFAEA